MSFWAVLTVINSLDRGRRAERGLTRHGFEFYNPQIDEAPVGQKPKIKQLFAGYLFIRLVDQWHILSELTDVIGVLKDSSGPLKVPDELVDAIRAREVDGVIRQDKPDPRSRFTINQQVRVNNPASAFHRSVASFIGMRGSDRCDVLLQMLGKTTQVTTEEWFLEPLPAEKPLRYRQGFLRAAQPA